MLTDSIQIKGKLKIEVFGSDGALKSSRTVRNLVVTAGKTVIANRLGLASPTKNAMTHMAIGTGATAAAAGDTTLQTENARVALAGSTPSTNTVVYTASFPAATGTGSVTEAGLLNASSAGDLLCRSVFTAIPKGAGDAVSITWTLTIS